MLKKLLSITLALFLLTGVAHAAEWYEGGNLHKSNAIAWQKANEKNKVATCADFIAGMWVDGKLTDKISTEIKDIDDIKPYAELLASQLDDAFSPDPDAKKNQQIFENQTVSSFAAMTMVLMGWLQ
ncbi:hypothetical protein Xsto_01863 [Xenorhabdus stockiae]|uniref:Uncharacterized protein n=1 Tax=Xenorhabdus stockiae TaxID=351614 RepID=A0A2D0KQJ3_9GAMM|nr:hypothetical protein [Xenorhabdus stockiae]PHM65711.1 hypothetical protein Xsto_01863 [Xenorhabdus stockiae]